METVEYRVTRFSTFSRSRPSVELEGSFRQSKADIIASDLLLDRFRQNPKLRLVKWRGSSLEINHLSEHPVLSKTNTGEEKNKFTSPAKNLQFTKGKTFIRLLAYT